MKLLKILSYLPILFVLSCSTYKSSEGTKRNTLLTKSEVDFVQNADGSILLTMGKDEATAALGIAEAIKQGYIIYEVTGAVTDIMNGWFGLEETISNNDTAASILGIEKEAEVELGGPMIQPIPANP